MIFWKTLDRIAQKELPTSLPLNKSKMLDNFFCFTVIKILR
jgi:hypothetical protein